MKKEIELKIRNKIRNILNESLNKENKELAFGHEEIDNLEKTLKPDEHIWLDDRTGNLTGEKVSKKEYLKRMLKRAMDEKKWSTVGSAILFLDTQI
jgi:hypothetical protein